MAYYLSNRNIIGKNAPTSALNFPIIGSGSGGSILFNGSFTHTTGTYSVSYTGTMGYFDITAPTTVTIEAYGGAGGRGRWNSNDNPGAPGGFASATFTLGAGRYYYWVGEGNKSVSGTAGSGGGSTDVRSVYNGGTTHNITNFLETASLNSRFIVAGGGGGSHGGSPYGYWGLAGDQPGRGGPDRSVTNCSSTQDAGHTNTGADSTQAGLDGGSSVDTGNYTSSGVFGRGGWPTNFLNEGYTNTGSSRSGWGWPNGGSGTNWAAGGGGGGWYGGATNWPNGGGGSNYIQGLGGVTLVSSLSNTTSTNAGNGSLNFILP